MTPDLPARLAALAELGYTVGVAHGSVAAEEEALEQARANAQPEQVAGLVEKVAAEVLKQAMTQGVTGAELGHIVTRASAQAERGFSGQLGARLEFHERALAVARATPTVYVISGHGVHNIYVQVDDATGDGADEAEAEKLALLADEAAIAERTLQLGRDEGEDAAGR